MNLDGVFGLFGSNAVAIGAAYGALQAIAQLVMVVIPKHTVAWRVAKFIVSGPQRPTV